MNTINIFDEVKSLENNVNIMVSQQGRQSKKAIHLFELFKSNCHYKIEQLKEIITPDHYMYDTFNMSVIKYNYWSK